jgi:hypothetical protein
VCPVDWLAQMVASMPSMDHDRGVVRPPREIVRAMRDRRPGPVLPAQPERLGHDPDDQRIEVEQHHVVALEPRLEADVRAGRRRPPQPTQMPLPLPGPEPAHRPPVFERHQPCVTQSDPLVSAIRGAHAGDFDLAPTADCTIRIGAVLRAGLV